MRKALAWRNWLTGALVVPVALAGGLAPAAGQSGETGVVVETVGEGSVLEKAGLLPGDVLVSWERLPARWRIRRQLKVNSTRPSTGIGWCGSRRLGEG